MRVGTGLELNVLEWCPTAAPERTVLLLHGFLDTAWTWEPLAHALAGAQIRLVAPDLRGHGDSDRVGTGGYYHFLDYLPDIAGVFDEIGVERLCLVGHSMGGTLASYFAGIYPEKIQRLALLEGIGPPEDDTDVPERVRAWIAAWARRRDQSPRGYADVDAIAQRLCASDDRLSPEHAGRLADKGTRLRPDGQREFKHHLLHLTRGPYPFRVDIAESFWRRVSCPVLYLEGEASSYRALGPEIDRRLACFSDVRRLTLPGAAHMLQRHVPELLGSVLTRFWAGEEPTQP